MSSMTEEQKYNGWANYPTWAVNLWLQNDPDLYDRTLTLLAQSKRRSTPETSRVHAADTLKSFVRDDLAPDLGASFAADLLGYALDSVDWFEIADAWLES